MKIGKRLTISILRPDECLLVDVVEFFFRISIGDHKINSLHFASLPGFACHAV